MKEALDVLGNRETESGANTGLCGDYYVGFLASSFFNSFLNLVSSAS